MSRYENLAVVASGSVGPVVLLLYLLGLVTTDASFTVIGFTFAWALVPGLIENYNKKLGWSKRSCAMTGNNLWAMSVIFLMIGLPFTAISEAVAALMWTALLVQAFVYSKPKSDPEFTEAEYQESRAVIQEIAHNGLPCKIDMEHLMMGGGAWCMTSDVPHEIPNEEADRMLAAAEKFRMNRTQVRDLPDSSYPYGTASDGTQWDDMGPI